MLPLLFRFLSLELTFDILVLCGGGVVSGIVRVTPKDPKHPKVLHIIFDGASRFSEGVVEFDTEESARDWRREIQGTIILFTTAKHLASTLILNLFSLFFEGAIYLYRRRARAALQPSSEDHEANGIRINIPLQRIDSIVSEDCLTFATIHRITFNTDPDYEDEGDSVESSEVGHGTGTEQETSVSTAPTTVEDTVSEQPIQEEEMPTPMPPPKSPFRKFDFSSKFCRQTNAISGEPVTPSGRVENEKTPRMPSAPAPPSVYGSIEKSNTPIQAAAATPGKSTPMPISTSSRQASASNSTSTSPNTTALTRPSTPPSTNPRSPFRKFDFSIPPLPTLPSVKFTKPSLSLHRDSSSADASFGGSGGGGASVNASTETLEEEPRRQTLTISVLRSSPEWGMVRGLVDQAKARERERRANSSFVESERAMDKWSGSRVYVDYETGSYREASGTEYTEMLGEVEREMATALGLDPKKEIWGTSFLLSTLR